MTIRYEHGGVVWVDLENPTLEEIEEIAKEFELGSLLIEEMLTPTAKPRVDLYPGFTYGVLHFPAQRFTHGHEVGQEIDIIFGNKFIITVHYTTMSATYDLAKAFEAESLLIKRESKVTAGHIFLELMQRLYKSADNELDALEDAIGEIEEHVFEGHGKEMVESLSLVSRELLTHERLLGTHHKMLEALETAVKTLFDEQTAHHVRAAQTLHWRVHQRTATMRDVLNELRETNMALLYTRQNEIMKNLTIIAFVTFPLTLIAGIFGMNTIHTPIVGTTGDFYIIVAGMAALTISFFIYFKLKRWF